MRKFYVYVVFRIDGSPCYVGKGKTQKFQCLDRRYIHLRRSHNQWLRRIVSKEGEVPIVTIRSGLSEPEAFEIEIALIKAIGRHPNGPLVNMTDGGDGLVGLSAETRAKMSASKRGVIFSPEHREKLSQAKLGKKQTPEAIEKRVAKTRGIPRPPEVREKVRLGLLGKKHTPERVAKNRAAKKIAMARPDVRARIAAATRAAMARPEVMAKMEADRARKAALKPQLTAEEKAEKIRIQNVMKSRAWRARKAARLRNGQEELSL